MDIEVKSDEQARALLAKILASYDDIKLELRGMIEVGIYPKVVRTEGVSNE